MALDFSPITSQPSVAERFFAGQREAQQNALAQQQLLHAQQQNALANVQMQEYQRKAAQANRLPGLLSSMPTTASVPEQVDVLTRAGFLDEARKLAESHAKAEADRRAAESAELKNQFDRLRLTGQLLSGATDEPSYRMVRTQVQQISPQFAAALPDVYDPDRLKAIISQGVDLEKRIADETARRGQDITAATAKEGQAVTMRGQDITAATTKRGQDITAGTAAARLALDQQKFAWEKANPGYEIKETPDGLIGVNKRDPSDTKPVMVGGKPVAGAKALTEAQGKATGFAMRAQEAHDILAKVGPRQWQTGFKQGVENVPFVGGALGSAANLLITAPAQQVDQAQREFVNAVMRQESGAAISASEFDNARKQYFPQPGDSDEVIEQKATNRETAIRSLEIAAGPGMRAAKAAAPNKNAAPKSPPTVKTDADYANLPSGTEFIAPDGTRRRKP